MTNQSNPMTVLPEQREGHAREFIRWLNGDVLNVLLDVSNGIDSPGLVSMARSGIRRIEAIVAGLAAIESAGAGETSGYITEVPDKSDRIIWRGHYYKLPPAASPAHAAPEQGAVTDEQVERALAAISCDDTMSLEYLCDCADLSKKEARDVARAALTAALATERQGGEGEK